MILSKKLPGLSFLDFMTMTQAFTCNLELLAAADTHLHRVTFGKTIEPRWHGDLFKFLYRRENEPSGGSKNL